MSRMQQVSAWGTERLCAYLAGHPHVEVSSFCESAVSRMDWKQGNWSRVAHVGKPDLGENYGLIELMDNNPLVCADRASTPGAEATLALIATGPLLRADLLTGNANLHYSGEGDFEETTIALRRQSSTFAPQFSCEQGFANNVAQISARLEVKPTTKGDLIELFEEAYGRSFFVKHLPGEEFKTSVPIHTPNAIYSLEIPDSITVETLFVHVKADINGKCGAAQLVHLYNIMSGNEESLGLS